MLRRRVAAVALHRQPVAVGGVYLGGCTSGLCGLVQGSATRHYTYHPPGTREPSLPWYGNTRTSTAAALPTTAVGNNSSTAASREAARPAARDERRPVQATNAPSNSHPHGAAEAHRLTEMLSPAPGTAQAVGNVSEAAVQHWPIRPPQPAGPHMPQSQQTAASATPIDTRPPGTTSSASSAPPRISLDTRIEDIIRVEETMAGELLPKVVQLLIDPAAQNVERITLSDFAAMQPKRQLLALGNQKAWHDWLLASPYYQQVARLAVESPAHDLRALHQAGIYTLHQWTEQSNLVQVSAHTRSALDAAVEQSVTTYMNEVALVVNTSTQLEQLLNRWVADVVGKFILDALRVRVEAASAALWARRGALYNTHTSARSTNSSNSSSTVGVGGCAKDTEQLAALSLMFGEEDSSTSSPSDSGNSSNVAQGPVLRPGEACTLEHYYRFVLKVQAGVRQDYAMHHNAGLTTSQSSSNNGGSSSSHNVVSATAQERGDFQFETEVMERTYAVIATALTRLFEQAIAAQHLPHELRPLYENGYLALDRVPGLLKRAVSYLQLRTLPVRHFVFHSTEDAEEGQTGARSTTTITSTSTATHTSSTRGRLAIAPETMSVLDVRGPNYAAGTFLTGLDQMEVTLGEWTGQPVQQQQPHARKDSNNEASGREGAAQLEYLSVLHRLKRRLDRLSMTTLQEIMQDAERYGGHGFNACEALGLEQLFGPAKLVEDRLAAFLTYPPATSEKPIHFIEAGDSAGKTALLERLARRTRGNERAVLVRYGGNATPFMPDLDDHPLAFAARFWFRVALACCPYLIRTEELFSRAPRSVWWWANGKNWSWERLQSLIAAANRVGHGRPLAGPAHAAHGMAWSAPQSVPQLAAVLVDDVDRVLSSMEAKWGHLGERAMQQLREERVAASEAGYDEEEAAAAAEEEEDDDNNNDEEEDEGVEEYEGDNEERAVGGRNGGRQGRRAGRKGRGHEAATSTSTAEEEEEQEGREGVRSEKSGRTRRHARQAARIAANEDALTVLQRQHRVLLTQWSASTGRSLHEALSECFTRLSSALGQLELIFAGRRVGAFFLTHCGTTPCRRYFLPVAHGLGLPQRLRVLPLLAVLHALHLRFHLELPGLLYEVLKNCPGLTGKTLELFWSGRVAMMDLRTGNARLLQWEGAPATSAQLIQSYAPHELYVELPVRNALLQYPRWSRLRLVQLLQRQLSSASGYLTRGVDTTARDLAVGLVTPHNHTCAQVHPFALFLIFSHQELLDQTMRSPIDSLASFDDDSNSSHHASAAAAATMSRERSRTGQGSTSVVVRERKVVRAWAEVWAEYRAVVHAMGTDARRKRDAMRVLLHGALLLRSAAVAGAQLDLNLKVPPYGFPLLSSDVRRRAGGAHGKAAHTSLARTPAAAAAEQEKGCRATGDLVRKAAAAYKSFFTNATQSHFPFRPVVGLNGGCDVVFVAGSTLALYDLVTTGAELREVVYRFAEALLGVLHLLERQVLPADKIRQVQYTTVVSLDQVKSSTSSGSGGAAYVAMQQQQQQQQRRGCGPITSGRTASDAFSAAAVSSEGHTNTSTSNMGGGSGSGSAWGDVFTPTMAPAVPYFLDYSAVFEDSVMDRLRARQEPLGLTKVYRTLSDLLDELEQSHHIGVRQDVVSSQEELEALFSPTLMQLVPDATVLPPYTSPLVSTEELMQEAIRKAAVSLDEEEEQQQLVEQNAENGDDDDDDEVNETVGLDAEEEENDEQVNGLLLSRELVGAEAEEVGSDALLARERGGRSAALQREVLRADHELVHESAAMLEAMMNDHVDALTGSSQKDQAALTRTAQELHNDFAMEDAINYNTQPSPLAGNAERRVQQQAQAAQLASAQQGVSATGAMSSVGNTINTSSIASSQANMESTDALAWLHDIVSPEALLAGLGGGAASPEGTSQGSNISSSPSPPPPPSPLPSSGNSVEQPGAAIEQERADDEHSEEEGEEEEREEEKESVYDDVASLFPRTGAKRQRRAHPPQQHVRHATRGRPRGSRGRAAASSAPVAAAAVAHASRTRNGSSTSSRTEHTSHPGRAGRAAQTRTIEKLLAAALTSSGGSSSRRKNGHGTAKGGKASGKAARTSSSSSSSGKSRKGGRK